MTERRRLDPKWILIALLWCSYALNHADRQVLYTLFPALQTEFGFSNETTFVFAI